ncbi:MAG: universal stress protein [Porticoccaceae bacterium]|nr:universal stress protein [Porticoccaceae bacterium]
MKGFNKILAVVNVDSSDETAIIQALRLARDYQSDICFIDVIKPPGHWRGALTKQQLSDEDISGFIEQRRLAIEGRLMAIDPSAKANIVVDLGIAFIQIIKAVINDQYDLVVKCAEKSDWMGRMLGSEDMHLLRKCPCPVLMLKPQQTHSFRNILATVDINDASNEQADGRVQAQLNQQVLEYSATLCMPELSELHIGSAWEAYGEDFYRNGLFSRLPEEQVDQFVESTEKECAAKLEKLVDQTSSVLGSAAVQYLEPKEHLVKGKPSIEIPRMIEQYSIDLIVMGTVGRVGIPGLIIGNTAESILEQTQCSVLAIKPEGFKTPVA